MSELFAVDRELGLVAALAGLSLLAVWVPLWRGLRLCRRARHATRRVAETELRGELHGSAPVRGESARESLALLMARVVRQSLEEDTEHANPTDFVVDAARQYAQNEFDSSYARLLSMYANLLPPLGFVGTTTGMLVLFVSMHRADASLELGALALALTSSIFALCGFALLEAKRIRLYTRLLACLDGVSAQRETLVRKPPLSDA